MPTHVDGINFFLSLPLSLSLSPCPNDVRTVCAYCAFGACRCFPRFGWTFQRTASTRLKRWWACSTTPVSCELCLYAKPEHCCSTSAPDAHYAVWLCVVCLWMVSQATNYYIVPTHTRTIYFPSPFRWGLRLLVPSVGVVQQRLAMLP